MKKLLLIFSLIFLSATSFGQFNWWIDFDSPLNLERIVRDTIANPVCSWRVGQPAKTAFTSANSVPNAIVTDTFNPVLANDTSIFYLKHARDNIFPSYHNFVLHFWYQMDGDSTDFGIIEISPDTGNTWINVLTQDTTFQMIWPLTKPTLNGTTSGWTAFDLDFTNWASNWGTFPVAMTSDTILFRFTYITDSNSTPHDGWMIDDFNLEDWWQGIDEIQNDNLISISPNPTSNELRIHRMNVNDNSRVQILNCTGQILYDDSKYNGESIDTRRINNGIYLLMYSDDKSYSLKKFIVQH